MAFLPASMALAVLGKGLSPICSSTTSLPAALSRLATARTSKAVSADRPRAKVLSEAWLIRSGTCGWCGAGWVPVSVSVSRPDASGNRQARRLPTYPAAHAAGSPLALPSPPQALQGRLRLAQHALG